MTDISDYDSFPPSHSSAPHPGPRTLAHYRQPSLGKGTRTDNQNMADDTHPIHPASELKTLATNETEQNRKIKIRDMYVSSRQLTRT